jgi:hypothetical protein
MRYTTLLLLLLPLNILAQNWKTFDQADILFTAKYPAKWINKIKEEKRVFFTSPSEGQDDDFAENINVSVSTDPSFGTSLKIKDLMQEVIDNVKTSFDDFAEESRTAFKWNGIDAFEITYTGNTKGESPVGIRITQRLCFYKKRLYLVTYTALKASDNFAATAKQIINSIKFKS